jgi:hypothetical protein
MKIGYLLSGHPKTYNECIETFNLNLKDTINNIYSHLWWDNSHQGKCYKMHFSEKLESIDLSTYLIEKFGINNYEIESGKSFDITFFRRFTKDVLGDNSEEFYKIITPIILYGLLSQTYSVYQSYLISSKEDNDLLIRARPDLILTKNISEIIQSLELKDDTIFFQSSVNGGHLYAGEFPNKPCDWFFLGRPNVMGNFLKRWNEEIKERYQEGIIHTNELVRNICNDSNIKIQIVDFGAHIYKQATNYYDLYHNRVEKYLEDFDMKNMRPKNKKIWPYWIEEVNFKHFQNIKF